MLRYNEILPTISYNVKELIGQALSILFPSTQGVLRGIESATKHKEYDSEVLYDLAVR